MVNFTPVGGTPTDSTASAATGAKKTVGQDAFLQLLVAQIRNQNPLDPANGVEFLSQLAQFSQLEQTIGVRDEISALRTQVSTIMAAMPDNSGKNNDSVKTGESKNV
jgi:flagellar basal-body rod modification protein FlgD